MAGADPADGAQDALSSGLDHALAATQNLKTFPFKKQPGVSRRQINGLATLDFIPRAENIVFIEIDKDTGLRATPACPRRISEAFIAGTEPMEWCFYH